MCNDMPLRPDPCARSWQTPRQPGCRGARINYSKRNGNACSWPFRRHHFNKQICVANSLGGHVRRPKPQPSQDKINATHGLHFRFRKNCSFINIEVRSLSNVVCGRMMGVPSMPLSAIMRTQKKTLILSVKGCGLGRRT